MQPSLTFRIVQEPQDRVQEVRRVVLHAVHRPRRQRAVVPRSSAVVTNLRIVHSPVRGGARPVLRQRVRARLGIQLLQGVPDPGRDGHRRRGNGDVEAYHKPRVEAHGLLRLKIYYLCIDNRALSLS